MFMRQQAAGSSWQHSRCPIMHIKSVQLCSARSVNICRLHLVGRSMPLPFVGKPSKMINPLWRVPDPLYGGLKCALGKFSAGAPGQRLYERIGITGTVRNLEVTAGDNCWHCHSHAIWFTEKPLVGKALERTWLAGRNRWVDCVRSCGLPIASEIALKEFGFDLKTDKQYISDYVTKIGKETEWRVEHELSKQGVKLGTYDGKTPMQLLADFTFEGDAAAGVLWRHTLLLTEDPSGYTVMGLRRRLLGQERELTDEELMEMAQTGECPDWLKPPPTW